MGLPLFEPARLEIPDGTLIALYTDGLVESPTQDIDSGIHRLAAALSHPAPTLHELCSAAIDSHRTAPPTDDVTLLLARTRTSYGPGT
jgi:serine phosphatase RsbU (regulator of sigma subunit)